MFLFLGILIRQRVNAQPHGHQLVVHIPRTEVAVSGFLVAFFAREGCMSQYADFSHHQ